MQFLVLAVLIRELVDVQNDFIGYVTALWLLRVCYLVGTKNMLGPITVRKKQTCEHVMREGSDPIQPVLERNIVTNASCRSLFRSASTCSKCDFLLGVKRPSLANTFA